MIYVKNLLRVSDVELLTELCKTKVRNPNFRNKISYPLKKNKKRLVMKILKHFKINLESPFTFFKSESKHTL